jgi:hypothetical protein
VTGIQVILWDFSRYCQRPHQHRRSEIVNGFANSFFQIDLGLPSEQCARPSDIWPAKPLDRRSVNPYELVNIDTYISELVPQETRGRAFGFNQFIIGSIS